MANKPKNPEDVLATEIASMNSENTAPASQEASVTGNPETEATASPDEEKEVKPAKAADKAAKAADKAAKAEKEKEQQDMAAKAASHVPSEATLQRIENNSAAQINAGKKVMIFITPNNKEDKRTEVCINGHWWKIKKGEWVHVPEPVAQVLRQSERVLEENERLKGDMMVFN